MDWLDKTAFTVFQRWVVQTVTVHPVQHLKGRQHPCSGSQYFTAFPHQWVESYDRVKYRNKWINTESFYSQQTYFMFRPVWRRLNPADILQEKEPQKTQEETQHGIMCWELSTSGRWLSQAWHTSGLAGLAGEKRSEKRALDVYLTPAFLHCFSGKTGQKDAVFPSSHWRAALSGHLVPSCYPTGAHIMAELSNNWLVNTFCASSCSGSKNTELCRGTCSKSM